MRYLKKECKQALGLLKLSKKTSVKEAREVAPKIELDHNLTEVEEESKELYHNLTETQEEGNKRT